MSTWLSVILLLIPAARSIRIHIDGEPVSQHVTSISKALEIIEDVRAQSAEIKPATIYIEKGVYDPITLNSRDSNIKFIATSNDTIISGGYRINSTWNKQDNLWTTSIKLPSNYSKSSNTMKFPKQLWMNDNRRPKAQTPMLYWESAIGKMD